MTDEKITIERLKQLIRGDSLNVLGDPELQLAAIEAAQGVYERTRTDEDLDLWIASIEATIDLGTRVSALAEYLWMLKNLYDARAKGPLNAAQENEFARQLEELWGMLDEREQQRIEEITERFKQRA